MKKLILCSLILTLITSSFPCFALEATVHQTTDNVYVEGKVGTYIKKAPLTYTVAVDDEVVYVGQYKGIDLENGTYSFKFKNTQNLENAVINLKYGDEEISTSMLKHTDTNQIIEADVYVTDKSDRNFTTVNEVEVPVKVLEQTTLANGTTLPERTYESDYERESRFGLKAVVNLKNKFAYEENIVVMVASYDINNKLLDCQFKPVKAEYGEDGKHFVGALLPLHLMAKMLIVYFPTLMYFVSVIHIVQAIVEHTTREPVGGILLQII